MGGIVCRLRIKPDNNDVDEFHSNDDEITNNLLPSEIIENEYIKNLENNESNSHLLLRPSQIIKIEKQRIKNLSLFGKKKPKNETGIAN
tara:strand:- start:697 stop:963 length:267 start_codon:yes stop_codon:yes gene_type:complete